MNLAVVSMKSLRIISVASGFCIVGGSVWATIRRQEVVSGLVWGGHLWVWWFQGLWNGLCLSLILAGAGLVLGGASRRETLARRMGIWMVVLGLLGCGWFFLNLEGVKGKARAFRVVDSEGNVGVLFTRSGMSPWARLVDARGGVRESRDFEYLDGVGSLRLMPAKRNPSEYAIVDERDFVVGIVDVEEGVISRIPGSPLGSFDGSYVDAPR